VQHLVPSAIDRSLAGMLRRARAVAGKAPAP